MEKDKMYKIEKLCDIKHKMIDALNSELGKGIENIDTKEAGEVADIIKDLAEAVKNEYEACYYEQVIEAMTEESEEDYRYGYNNRRYSSGQYAPKGMGHISGYHRPMTKPFVDQMPYIDSYLRDPEGFRDDMNNRRGYNDPHMKDDKTRLSETVDSMREMWKHADTDLKKKIKADLSVLLNEMTV